MEVQLYGISDAGPDQFRYLGVTTRGIEQRLDRHVREALSTSGPHKRHWLRGALDAGRSVEIVQLDTAPTSADALWLERLWICVFRACGIRLTNSCDGGRGVLNPTPETRQKLRRPKPSNFGEAQRKRWAELSETDKINKLRGFDPQAHKWQLHSEKTKALMSERQRNRWAKVSDADRAAHAIKTFGATAEERSSRSRAAAVARWHHTKRLGA